MRDFFHTFLLLSHSVCFARWTHSAKEWREISHVYYCCCGCSYVSFMLYPLCLYIHIKKPIWYRRQNDNMRHTRTRIDKKRMKREKRHNKAISNEKRWKYRDYELRFYSHHCWRVFEKRSTVLVAASAGHPYKCAASSNDACGGIPWYIVLCAPANIDELTLHIFAHLFKSGIELQKVYEYNVLISSQHLKFNGKMMESSALMQITNSLNCSKGVDCCSAKEFDCGCNEKDRETRILENLWIIQRWVILFHVWYY